MSYLKSKDIEDTIKMKTGNLLIRNVYRNGDPEIYREYILEILPKINSYNKHDYSKIKKELNKKFHINPNVTGLNYGYYNLRNSLLETYRTSTK